MSGVKFHGVTPWPVEAAPRYIARGHVAVFLQMRST
jgi:hypothetical protein